MSITKGSQLSAVMHDVPQMDGGDVGSWKIVAPEERSGLPVCQLNDSFRFPTLHWAPMPLFSPES